MSLLRLAVFDTRDSAFTHSLLDPTNSGRATMDSLMKLVTTALEWTYEAGQTDVQEETLERAAELLMLRRDTIRIIEGSGSSVDVQDESSTSPVQTEPGNAKKGSQALSPTLSQLSDHTGEQSQKQPAGQPKCAFFGEVPIDLEQFLESGVFLVQCPDCTSTSALSPHKGILHFKPHKRRKRRSTSTEPRWVRREMIWVVVSG